MRQLRHCSELNDWNLTFPDGTYGNGGASHQADVELRHSRYFQGESEG
jgi:hypothetical protein